MSENNTSTASHNFIRDIIEADLSAKKHEKIALRFPPEPNGYLHLGHAKSICLNFGLAEQFNGSCNLRFDDTNPEKESEEYMKSIKEDVAWLGFEWDNLFYASDYFDDLYQMALTLIKKGLAYVDSQSSEQIKQSRGNLNTAGTNSPYRTRTTEENLTLFEQMRQGEVDASKAVLRAKIDMASSNMNLRDPIIYRIRNVSHYRTKDKWKIYPMYDFTHGQSDMLEQITHSLCTLEFEDHRPLYDWFIMHLSDNHQPRQIEFSRLQLEHTILSKRNLIRLVEEGHVDGWDDPRMPTIAGIRRRGIPAQVIKEFCSKIGITKKDATIELSFFDGILRDYLNINAPRRMAVLNPLKITIKNYGGSEKLTISNHPQNEEMGKRAVSFSNTLYIEQDDFKESANKKFKRLVLGGEVRLRGSYVIRCDEVVKDHDGNPVELICHYDNETLGKNPSDGRKVKGVIHWVDASTAATATITNYDRLFKEKSPGKLTGNAIDDLNPNSKQVVNNAKLEQGLANLEESLTVYQFERTGYYIRDKQSSSENLCFNQTIGLRDNWG